MTRKLLEIFQNGILQMRLNAKLFLVGALAFIFPLALVVFAHSVFSVASENIETVQKNRISTFHDAISIDPSVDTLKFLKKENPDIIQAAVIEQTNGGYKVKYSDPEFQLDPNDLAFMWEATVTPGKTLIFKANTTWQAVRRSEISGETLYIYSHHDMSAFFQVIDDRLVSVYLLFFGILLFLLGLTYWLARQHNWHKAHDDLQKELKERDLFTSTIIHEFRTPLTAISGYSDFLSESNRLRPKDREYLKNIDISTDRLLDLVNDFLEVSRLQSGRMKLDLQSLSVKDLVDETFATLSATATSKGLVLKDATRDPDIAMMADRKRIMQVLINVVSNSIKYTKQGTVTLLYQRQGHNVDIRVRDTGSGISATDQKKLFAPFSRVGENEKSEITGSGLGMWITRRLAELMGGTIEVESIKNVGTAIVITFPSE